MPSPDRASDHLANERTFLSWIRSAVALLGLGFVVAKFGFWMRQLALLESHRDVPATGISLFIGLGLLGFGGALAATGLARYLAVRRSLAQGTFAPAGQTVVVTAASVLSVTLLLMIYLLVSDRSL